jgi:hypothetical protein
MCVRHTLAEKSSGANDKNMKIIQKCNLTMLVAVGTGTSGFNFNNKIF